MRRLLIQVALTILFALTMAAPALADTITVTSRTGAVTCTLVYNVNEDGSYTLLSYSCSNPGRSTP